MDQAQWAISKKNEVGNQVSEEGQSEEIEKNHLHIESDKPAVGADHATYIQGRSGGDNLRCDGVAYSILFYLGGHLRDVPNVPSDIDIGRSGVFKSNPRSHQSSGLPGSLGSPDEEIDFEIIEIGAGKDIATVRNFSDDVMKQYNADLIRINPRDYDGEEGTIAIPLGAQEALEKIFN